MPITIHVPAAELYDENTQMIIAAPAVTLEMEHSLISLSKWEQKYKKPFLGKDKKTLEEAYGYFQAMCLGPEVPMHVIHRIDPESFAKINEYIDDKMTATWFTDRPGAKVNREIVTNEIIYHWIFAMTLSKEVETWHLNRLFTLLKVVNEKNAPPKKQSRSEIAARHREINERNKALIQARKEAQTT